MFNRTCRTRARHNNVLTSQMDLNLRARTILPCKLQSNTRDQGEKRIYCVAVFGSKLQLKKEIETSAIALTTVLDKLLCFLSCPEFDILPIYLLFFWNLSSWLSSLFFGKKICPGNSREIGRFLREFVSKNPTKFDFFPRELSEALNIKVKGDFKYLRSVKISTDRVA